MKRIIAAGAVATFAALAGCSDLEGPDTNRAPRISHPSGRPAASRTATATPNMAARKWFAIEFDTPSSLKPNAPITVSTTFTANFATDDADLHITLPEIESAKESEWEKGYRPTIGTVFSVKVEESRAFSSGDKVSESVTFAVESAGTYRLHASAISSKYTTDETTDRVQPAAHATV